MIITKLLHSLVANGTWAVNRPDMFNPTVLFLVVGTLIIEIGVLCWCEYAKKSFKFLVGAMVVANILSALWGFVTIFNNVVGLCVLIAALSVVLVINHRRQKKVRK